MYQFETLIINNLFNPEIVLIAFLIDRLIGEFPIKHPVSIMGDYISWYERKFYADSILRGALLTLTLIIVTVLIMVLLLLLISSLPEYIAIISFGIIASTGLAGKMLYESVKNILIADDKKKALSYLVSRDTENMSDSDIYKGAIETYAENLSDGVIAPLFYLILFGVIGLFIYKAINTLDSMVGYRTSRYERFGKFSARLDDVMNYIPARITSVLISVVSCRWESVRAIFQTGSKHSSPNAGYPISAMAGAIGVSLGGPTSYQGELKEKPYFGSGRINIEAEDLVKTLSLRKSIDIILIGGLALWILISHL